jgi:uncharacterized protein YraI
MKKYAGRGWMFLLAVWLAAVTCNMPLAAPQAPVAVNTISAQQVDVAATAAQMALTMAAPGSTTTATVTTAPPIATQCNPTVTANMDANVRVGPGTDYDIIGFLPASGTARIAGQNDGRTWWYIEFAAGTGGHAWVAGSVTTAACLPAVVQVVAAPPLPPTPTFTLPPPVALQPDLIVSEFTISPETPIMGQSAHVRIGAYNQGDGPSGPYVVVWYGLSTFASPSCSWNVNHNNPHGGKILECDFTFQSWYPINKTSVAIVDVNNQIDESDEGNNIGQISPFGVAKP